jgi:hypothetical protein
MTSAAVLAAGSGTARAQYGYQIGNGRIGPGFAAGYGMYPRGYGYGGYGGARTGTVTDYGSLMNLITQIPGWYGPSSSAHHRPLNPERPKPTIPRQDLLGDDGTIKWPSTTPSDPGVLLSRQAAEGAVKQVVDDKNKYGKATIREVIDARNKLKDFAARALPEAKAHDAVDGDLLERFIVELQKTLATFTDNY